MSEDLFISAVESREEGVLSIGRRGTEEEVHVFAGRTAGRSAKGVSYSQLPGIDEALHDWESPKEAAAANALKSVSNSLQSQDSTSYENLGHHRPLALHSVSGKTMKY